MSKYLTRAQIQKKLLSYFSAGSWVVERRHEAPVTLRIDNYDRGDIEYLKELNLWEHIYSFYTEHSDNKTIASIIFHDTEWTEDGDDE